MILKGIGFLLFNMLIYIHFKNQKPKYKFQGQYSIENVGGHQTQLLRFPGKKSTEQYKNTVIVVIGGNPGVAHFYDKFMKKLHDLLNNEIDMVAIGQIHHYNYQNKEIFKTHTLQQNIEQKQALVQKLLQENPDRKFIFIGHSIGAFMCLHSMKVLRKDQIIKTHMLYPTVFKMFESPSGQRNKLLNHEPIMHVAATILGGLRLFVPNSILRWILEHAGFQGEFDTQESIIEMLSYSNAMNAFKLGQIEMKEVDQLPRELIQENLDKCFYYFGTTDGWVPMSYVEILKKEFPQMNYQVDTFDLKHAFVIGGGEKQAEIQYEIIKEDLNL